MTDSQLRLALGAELRRMTPGIPEADVPRFVDAILASGGYVPCAEASPREGVAAGLLVTHRFTSANVYPGVERNVQIYRPAGEHREYGLIVFQDGARYLGPEVNAAIVLDNLIAAGEIPPVIGLFVEPGESGPGLPIYGGEGNRSVEYDSIGDAYARFLVEELVPGIAGEYPLREGPSWRAIAGLSSGGICAFNAAWERPDQFSGVLSHCGSFVDIRGGHTLAPAVRRAAPKALRVFLQTGEQDLDIVFGNWPLANRELAAALAYRGYDHQLVIGSGGHSLAHGGALFADALRWLWRDWRAQPSA